MTTIEQYYKESITEKYIEDFKHELNFFEKILIAPMTKKMQKILNSNDAISVDNLGELESLGFWRRILGIKIGDKKLFEKLIDKTFNFLKEKQEKIIQAETDGKLFNLLQEVIGIEQTEDTLQNPPEVDINDLGEFSDSDFVFGESIEKQENGKTYIEISGKKYYQYEENMNGLGYQKDVDEGWLYIGEFKDGLSQGMGVFVTKDGNKYEGQWREDERYGKGTEIMTDGSTYTGEWKNDKKEGQGKYTCDNYTYEGKRESDSFVEGKFINKINPSDPKTYDVQTQGGKLLIVGPEGDADINKEVKDGEIVETAS